ncbi:MAG: amidohydrolase family protein [Saprospiraceae bacterium]|nr:amidohydrolase family protein [Saprospiraceae bacterium]
MHRFYALIYFCLLNIALLAQDGSLLLQGGTLVDVESKTIRPNTNILIEEGRITTISDQPINTPADVRRISLNGQFIMPGLVDAHIHLFQSGGLYTRPDAIDLQEFHPYEKERQWVKDNAEQILKRYLRVGVTTVIDVGGPLANYELRDRFKVDSGTPNVWLTGPLVSTYQPAAFQIDDPPIIKVKNAEEAKAIVRKQLPYKPDLIKIWYIVRRGEDASTNYNLVKATIDESHKHGLKVAVHATQLNTAKLAVKAGADILVHSVDDPIDRGFISLLQQNNTVYIPTLVVSRKYLEVFGQNNDLSYEDFTMSDPTVLGSLFDLKHLPKKEFIATYKQRATQRMANTKAQDQVRKNNLKKLAAAGITIATGTDAGNIGTLHASSYLRELFDMRLAGMDNFSVLQASTINGAKVLGRDKDLGSIKEGKIADLLILTTNPAENLDHIQDIEYVIKDGKVYEPEEILPDSPVDLAQRQLNGYNARNIEAFLEPYSDNVELYRFPDQLMGKGRAFMRSTYSKMFENTPDLHCELVNRIVQGDTVIDRERVTGFGAKPLEATAIYKIKDGKIVKVYFIQ